VGEWLIVDNYLDNIKEGQPLDSIQDVYQTHTTIMKDLIDSDTYDKMMVRVCKDIMENEEILEKIKGLKQKQRMFIGDIIFMWARREWGNHFNNSTSRWYRAWPSGRNRGYANRSNGQSPWGTFYDNFEKSFSKSVLWECEYKVKSNSYEIRVKQPEDNEYNVLMNENAHWSRRDVEARMIVKYDEQSHILKICYIEYTGGNWKTTFKPKVMRAELFKGVKKIMKQIAEDKNSEPKIECSKRCIKVYEEAKRRKYLEDPKQEE
jgi:hypothetical protein